MFFICCCHPWIARSIDDFCNPNVWPIRRRVGCFLFGLNITTLLYFKNKKSDLRNSSKLLLNQSERSPRDFFKVLQKQGPSEILSNYFKNKTKGVLEILSNYFKNYRYTRRRLYTKHERSARFFQTTYSKLLQKSVINGPQDSFKLFQNSGTRDLENSFSNYF